MTIERKDIEHVVRLARVELTGAELEKYGEQLEAIVGYIDQLKRLDVSKVEPLTHAGDFGNVFRADDPRPCLPASEALQNAPEAAGSHFVVPRVIEE